MSGILFEYNHTNAYRSCYRVLVHRLQLYCGVKFRLHYLPEGEGKVRVERDERLSSRENLIRNRDGVELDLAAAMGLDA